jgi:hypothetical protein
MMLSSSLLLTVLGPLPASHARDAPYSHHAHRSPPPVHNRGSIRFVMLRAHAVITCTQPQEWGQQGDA